MVESAQRDELAPFESRAALSNCGELGLGGGIDGVATLEILPPCFAEEL
jgi:hypothetical protein